MANRLESHCVKDHQGHGKPRLNRLSEMPDKAVEAIFVGFTKTLCRNDPSRIHQLRRVLDARIRGAGMFADEHMVHLAQTLDRHIRGHGPDCDRKVSPVSERF